MTTKDQYLEEIQKYESKYLNRTPCLETVPYDLKFDWPANKQIACAEDTGVYAFFNENYELLYVGKASHKSSLGHRIYSHFYPKPDDDIGAKPKKDSWTGELLPRYSLSTATAHAFEAPSLEEYLIQELQPPLNTVGRLN